MSRLHLVAIGACSVCRAHDRIWLWEGRCYCAEHWRAALDAWGRARDAAGEPSIAGTLRKLRGIGQGMDRAVRNIE